MKSANRLPRISRKKMAKLFALVFLLLVFLPALAFAGYSLLNRNLVYANQYTGGLDLTKRNQEEVRALLTQRAGDFNAGVIALKYQSVESEKIFPIKPNEIGVHFDIEATTANIWQVGRSGNFFHSLSQQIDSIFIRTDHPMVYTYNDEALNDKLKSIAKEIDRPEKDYTLIYNNGKFKLSAGRSAGKRIDQGELAKNLKERIGNLAGGEIAFETKNYEPKVSEEKARNRLAEANRIIEAGDLTLKYESQQFKLDIDTIGGMVRSIIKDDDLEITFDDDRVNTFLDSVAQSINVEAQNAKLNIINGKAEIYQSSQTGKTLDKEATRLAVISALLQRVDPGNTPPLEVTLLVKTKAPDISESQINNLGIIELVGTGTTSFKGSPANRIHNIQTGAAALNGALIKPGETFSTLAKLGEISDKSGYLPELVIKENQTIPEFGGGLCQVSTTLFRAAINTGMKITARQNHKYRVGYYEPPIGMDATIYDPAPDFKFQNNFSSHVLIQSKVEGTKITFDLYGTKDSRQVEIGEPQTWDEVPPGEAVTVETDTLPAGERKQVEKAHAGISAKFHYKVSKDGQTLQETDFLSKYVPWPEKWLVGKTITPPTDQPPAQ